MADEQITGANDNTGATGEGTTAPENTGAQTLLGGDPGAQDTKPEGQDTKPEEQRPVVPEEYADFTFPEGIEIDKAQLDAAKAQFKEAGYTQEQAQKAIDLYIKSMQEQQELFLQERKNWVNEIKADKEFGGDKFDATVKGAQLALRKFDADGKMVELLETSGFGDHPGVIKFLARIHAALSEDKVFDDRERGGKTDNRPLAERLYGKDGMGPANPQ
jgi:hypothetical protein